MMHQLGEWFRAKRRGDKRIAPTATRGRVYARRKDREDSGNRLSAKTRPRATISARVFHATTGEWEDLGVISSPEVG